MSDFICVPHESVLYNSEDITKLGVRDPHASHFAHLHASLGPSRKLLHLVRHGEGEHNAAERRVGKEEWESTECKKSKYFDPPLNAVGVQQCAELKKAVDEAFKTSGMRLDAVYVSPLSRAIQTAFQSLPIEEKGLNVISVEYMRERHGKNVCDKRRTVSELRTLFPLVDFGSEMSGEEDTWHDEFVRETPEQVAERVDVFLDWVFDRESSTVAVVGHSDFMSTTIERVGGGSHWPSNCEMVTLLVEKK